MTNHRCVGVGGFHSRQESIWWAAQGSARQASLHRPLRGYAVPAGEMGSRVECIAAAGRGMAVSRGRGNGWVLRDRKPKYGRACVMPVGRSCVDAQKGCLLQKNT